MSDSHPKEIIRYALTDFPNCMLSFSGAEDVVLIDMAMSVLPKGHQLQVFSLDTGRLHSETYRFIETIRDHYKIQIDLLSPVKAAVEQLVKEKGLYSFYRDGHNECCAVRKIAPLRRHLVTADAWITGQRRDQSPDTRAEIAVVEEDTGFAGPDRQLYKFNPLANWSSAQVWEYIRMFDVPYNPLHDRGFISIGCEPCTRPVGPNQHERDGRWWWENSKAKECGLHVSHAVQDRPNG